MKFSDLNFKPHPSGMGEIATVEFENGYGASIITGGFSYSSSRQPYEVAVIYGGDLAYDTPITDDVIGYLTSEEVMKILEQIEDLPERTK